MKPWKLAALVAAALMTIGVIASTAGAISAAAANQASAESVNVHKVLAPPGVIDGRSGVTRWHDYGSYVLYQVTESSLKSFSPAVAARVRVADDMDFLYFENYPFNTQKDALDLPIAFQAPASEGASLHLIQFVGPVKAAWLDAVAATGAVPVHYVFSNGYLVWADASARAQLDELASKGEIVQFSAPHQPYLKLGQTLVERVEKGPAPSELVTVTVQMLDHEGKTETETLVKTLAQAALSAWTPVLNYQNIIIQIALADVVQLVQRPDITWVGERLERELMDEVQGQILAGNFDGSQSGPASPGYLAWLDSFGFSQNPSDYPIVDITDDGIGNGTVNSGDPTLHEFGSPANPTRLAFVDNCTNSSSGQGPDGHGHINVSIAGGYDVRTGFPFEDPDGYQRGLGINPYGRFAGTRIFDPGFDLSSCGGTDTGLIKSEQDSGAIISSNSWGCSGCAGLYDDGSQAFDAGTRDADLTEPGNQEMIFVFSAGNSGPSSATVGTPGNGKNMITVGASENDRPSDEDGNWTDGCNIGSTGANNAMDVISFSSRGPAPGNRVKPEVIGPGTHVQGTASTNAAYNGSGVCDQFRPSGQTVFAASSGTSHSAPAVAGVSSLIYWWLENNSAITSDAPLITPSAAAIKAYLIAHPTYLTGIGANDTLPSNSQGFGMPNMGLMFDSTAKYVVDQSVLLNNSGETWTWSGSVADSGQPVRIVLAYTDQAGAIGVSPQVNDLNLSADVGGSSYLGNVFSGQWSAPGGSADSANNYEAIFLPAGTSGTIDLTITGFNIAGDGVPNTGDSTDQDFALVCYNCTQMEGFTLAADPASQEICTPADAIYTVAVDPLSGFSDPVTLSATGNPAGTTANFSPNPITPPGGSDLTIGNTGAAAAGSYSVEILGSAGLITNTVSVGLEVFTAAPGAPVLSAPADGATGVPLEPTFSWTGVAEASAYQVEVAADAGFTNVVYSASEPSTSHTVPGGSGLSPATTYFWRVSAQNPCGSGGASAVFSFTTIDQLTVHAGDLDNESANYGTDWTATVRIQVHDASENPVASATVSGTWSRGVSGTGICVTAGDGTCTVDLPGVAISRPLVRFSVDSISGAGLTYNASANHDPESDSNGTLINVLRPSAIVTPTPVGPTATPTNTPIPPTPTPSTPTPIPPTPTNTPIPPTPTPITPTPIPPTPTNTPTPGGSFFVHVADLDDASTSQGTSWTGAVVITVQDENLSPVAGVTVTGTFTRGTSGTFTCVTDGSGQCTISRAGILNSRAKVLFRIDNLSHAFLAYDPVANTDPDGDSDGTMIDLFRP